MITVKAASVPEALYETITSWRLHSVAEQTRNGTARSFPCPFALTIVNPRMRVLTDPTRDANPFFHAMEFIWMMSGSNNINWISKFNKQMLEYSDDGLTQWAAYGHRWRKWFGYDQIKKAIAMLRRNPQDRRIVISMWDPRYDLGRGGKDLPCNTQIHLRVFLGRLDMTVCNRSNDIIWGMLGANAVHMTMLHELIASAAGIPLGCYRVISNNAHIYESVPNFEYYLNGILDDRDVYFNWPESTNSPPLLREGETYADFVADCEAVLSLPNPGRIHTHWMRYVGSNIYKVWLQRKTGFPYDTSEILADDWRIACEEWIARRNTTVGDQQRDYYAGHASREQASKGLDPGTFQPNPLASVDNSEYHLGLAPIEPSFDGALHPQPPEVANKPE